MCVSALPNIAQMGDRGKSGMYRENPLIPCVVQNFIRRACAFVLLLVLSFSAAACGNSSPGDRPPAYEAEEAERAVQTEGEVPAGGEMNIDLKMAPDIKRITDRGKLLVGIYSQDMPPFFMTDEKGELYGYDIDVARNIAKHLKVDVAFDRSASSYQELFEKVARSEVDVVIAKFSVTLERAKYVRFTKPYLEMRRALLVNRKHALAADAEDYPMDFLRGDHVKIGVKAMTSYAAFARELFPDAGLVELPEWQDVVGLLAKGEITAAMYDELEVIRLVRQNPDISLYSSVYILKDQKDLISMAVPYESTQFLSWLDWFMEYQKIKCDVNTLMKDYAEVFEEK